MWFLPKSKYLMFRQNKVFLSCVLRILYIVQLNQQQKKPPPAPQTPVLLKNIPALFKCLFCVVIVNAMTFVRSLTFIKPSLFCSFNATSDSFPFNAVDLLLRYIQQFNWISEKFLIPFGRLGCLSSGLVFVLLFFYRVFLLKGNLALLWSIPGIWFFWFHWLEVSPALKSCFVPCNLFSVEEDTLYK